MTDHDRYLSLLAEYDLAVWTPGWHLGPQQDVGDRLAELAARLPVAQTQAAQWELYSRRIGAQD